jgi:nucleoside-diphosphate-sugar epimerase
MFFSPLDDLKHIELHLDSLSNHLQDKTIFLSGATGFIGKGLIESLVWLSRSKKLNLSIHSISRNPPNFFQAYPHFLNYPEFHLRNSDIRDKEISYYGKTIDFVIHAATDVIGSKKPRDIFSACVDGTSNILNFAKKNKCKNFLLLSSGAVYGQQPRDLNRIPESFEGAVNLSSPGSAYALGKQCSEWLTQQEKSYMQIKIARCFAFVGPYLPLDQHFAIGNFLQDAIVGNDIQILGDSSAVRTYLYTSDLTIWLLKILISGSNGGVWNVGGNEEVSIADLAHLVAKIINPDLEVKICRPPSEIPHRYIPDIRKAAIEMALIPRIQLGKAIEKTAHWNRHYGEF